MGYGVSPGDLREMREAIQSDMDTAIADLKAELVDRIEDLEREVETLRDQLGEVLP